MGQQQWRLFVSPALKAVRYNSTGMLQTGCSIRSRDKGCRGYKQLILNLLQNEFIIYTENILQSKATSRPGRRLHLSCRQKFSQDMVSGIWKNTCMGALVTLDQTTIC